MNKTKDNKGITIISLVIVVILLIIMAVITITSITDNEIIPKAKNSQNEYQAMTQNKYNEMEGDRVLNILDLDE